MQYYFAALKHEYFHCARSTLFLKIYYLKPGFITRTHMKRSCKCIIYLFFFEDISFSLGLGRLGGEIIQVIEVSILYTPAL